MEKYTLTGKGKLYSGGAKTKPWKRIAKLFSETKKGGTTLAAIAGAGAIGDAYVRRLVYSGYLIEVVETPPEPKKVEKPKKVVKPKKKAVKKKKIIKKQKKD